MQEMLLTQWRAESEAALDGWRVPALGTVA